MHRCDVVATQMAKMLLSFSNVTNTCQLCVRYSCEQQTEHRITLPCIAIILRENFGHHGRLNCTPTLEHYYSVFSHTNRKCGFVFVLYQSSQCDLNVFDMLFVEFVRWKMYSYKTVDYLELFG